MAHIVIRGTKGAAEIRDNGNDEPWYVYDCAVCGTIDTDRGNFEDTIERACQHVDIRCPGLGRSEL